MKFSVDPCQKLRDASGKDRTLALAGNFIIMSQNLDIESSEVRVA